MEMTMKTPKNSYALFRTRRFDSRPQKRAPGTPTCRNFHFRSFSISKSAVFDKNSYVGAPESPLGHASTSPDPPRACELFILPCRPYLQALDPCQHMREVLGLESGAAEFDVPTTCGGLTGRFWSLPGHVSADRPWSVSDG